MGSPKSKTANNLKAHSQIRRPFKTRTDHSGEDLMLLATM